MRFMAMQCTIHFAQIYTEHVVHSGVFSFKQRVAFKSNISCDCSGVALGCVLCGRFVENFECFSDVICRTQKMRYIKRRCKARMVVEVAVSDRQMPNAFTFASTHAHTHTHKKRLSKIDTLSILLHHQRKSVALQGNHRACVQVFGQ